MVCPSFFAKRHSNFRRNSLLATPHKSLILAVEFMHVDQDPIEVAKGVEVVVTTQARSAAENMEKLEFKLIVLKGFDVLARIFMQLEAVC